MEVMPSRSTKWSSQTRAAWVMSARTAQPSTDDDHTPPDDDDDDQYVDPPDDDLYETATL